MATGYYLLDNKPRIPQHNTRRRNGGRVTGTFDVHTWESAPDWVGHDTGLEGALPYLLDRTNFGSYHSAMDSDSTRRIVPWWMEAFHDTFTNNWAIGISMCTQAHKWSQAPRAWRAATLRRAAEEAARIADEVYTCTDLTRVARLGIDIPAVWLTRAQAHARQAGFVRHGTSDPGRRSDPWPANAPEAGEFLELYKQARRTGRYAAYKTKKVYRTRAVATLAAIATALGVTVASMTSLNPGIDPAEPLTPGVEVTAPAQAHEGNDKYDLVVPAVPAAPGAPGVPGGQAGQAPVSGQVPTGSAAFPTTYPALAVDGRFRQVSVGAHQVLMHNIGKRHNHRWDGDFGRLTVMDTQEWLAGLGYYHRRVDGGWGYYSVTALQEFLADKGLYHRRVDGSAGYYTAVAWQQYLNIQRAL